MKNVNFNQLMELLVIKFGITNFDFSSIVKNHTEPIDLHIKGKMGYKWLRDSDEEIDNGVFDFVESVENKIKACITGEVKQFNVDVIGEDFKLYIEFANSEFIDELQ